MYIKIKLEFWIKYLIVLKTEETVVTHFWIPTKIKNKKKKEKKKNPKIV